MSKGSWEGPYDYVSTVVEAFAHNAAPRLLADGSVGIWFIGYDGAVDPITCTSLTALTAPQPAAHTLVARTHTAAATTTTTAPPLVLQIRIGDVITGSTVTSGVDMVGGANSEHAYLMTISSPGMYSFDACDSSYVRQTSA